MTPRISVIVPVYKVEKYLPKCIDSILAQTFTDFELLLIDDGSPDNSGAICDEYAKKDSRIRVFHKENGGVSSARNLGLDEAKGEWIAFVDSDDWVGERYIEDLFDGIQSDGVGLVFQGHTKVNAKIEDNNYTKFETGVVIAKQFSSLFSVFRIYKYGAPWSKLFNLKVLTANNIRFDIKINRGEDLLFMFDYLVLCDWVSIINCCGYMYNTDVEESLTRRINPYQSEIYTFNKLYCRIQHFSKQFNIDRSIMTDCYVFLRLLILYAINSIYHSNYSKHDRISILKEIFSIDVINCFKVCSSEDSYLSFKIMRLLLLNKSFYLYDFYRVNISGVNR